MSTLKAQIPCLSGSSPSPGAYRARKTSGSRPATPRCRHTLRVRADASPSPPDPLPPSVSRRLLFRAGFATVSAAAILAWSDLAGDSEKAKLYGPEQGVGTKYKLATFAGGCFWCMEPPFDRLGDGVIATISGYTGGKKEDPSYAQVSAGTTGHAEAVQVVYDPTLVTYEQLLDAYWHSVDPTTPNRQFVDVGTQYRTAIFYHDEEQKRLAEASVAKLSSAGVFKAPIVTEITQASAFWPAEVYHQDYYEKKSAKYSFYRSLSGRDEYIQSVWGPDCAINHTCQSIYTVEGPVRGGSIDG